MLFAAALIYSIWAATLGWETSLMGEHSFRQTSTAISAYYIAKGGPFLKYETPILGPPWSIPFEFPLYQWIAAKVHLATGWTLESAGRVTAKVFFYLSLAPIALLAFLYGVRGALLFVPMTLFLLSPLYLFWSRQFLIESTATFFGLAYLAASCGWARRGGWSWIAAAVVCGALASLVKSTSYATYGLAIGLAFLWELRGDATKRQIRWLTRGGLVLAVPLAVGVIWAKFADSVKAENPLADFILSSALVQWNFGTLAQRLDGNFWYMLFRQTIHDAIGHRTGWLLSLLLAICLGRRALAYWVLALLFLSAPLIFTNLHIIHNYYANANAVFLVLAVAAVVIVALQHEKTWLRVFGGIVLAATCAYEVREFMRQPYHLLKRENAGPMIMGAEIQKLVPDEEKVLIIFGWDWDTTPAYFARRRGIAARGIDWSSPKLQQSLLNLAAEGRQVGAVLFCGGTNENPALTGDPRVGKVLHRSICAVREWRGNELTPAP